MVHDLIAQFKHIQNAPHGDRKGQKGNRLVRSIVLINKVEKINGNQSAGQDDTMDAVTKNFFHVFLLQFTLTFRDRNMQKNGEATGIGRPVSSALAHTGLPKHFILFSNALRPGILPRPVSGS